MKDKTQLSYRHRIITDDDLQFIRELIAKNPHLKRNALSVRLCEEWNWRQPNGQLRAMVCRSMLLMLHRAGHIKLPETTHNVTNAWRKGKRFVPFVPIDQTPIKMSLSELGPLEVRQVRRTPEEGLFNSLLDEHHYLKYVQPVGEHLKFLISAGGQTIACAAFSSSPRHLGCRDRYIGWSAAARLANIRYIAYQQRFLILPWVEVPHLASHLLSRLSYTVSEEWQKVYCHPLYFIETFVDPTRFRGTCYRAANWVEMGETLGLGKDAQTNVVNRTIKKVMGMPLVKDFRERLASADPMNPPRTKVKLRHMDAAKTEETLEEQQA